MEATSEDREKVSLGILWSLTLGVNFEIYCEHKRQSNEENWTCSLAIEIYDSEQIGKIWIQKDKTHLASWVERIAFWNREST